MNDLPERFELAQQWERVLASFTQRPGIKRVSLQERTLPTTIRAARDHYESVQQHRNLDSHSPVAENYAEVMDASERFAVAHRNYLTFTIDLIGQSAQLRALGGGKDAILSLAAIEAANLADALRAAKIRVRRWLSPRDIAALARIAFDPDFAATVQNRAGDLEGVDPSAIGPMHLEEPSRRNAVVLTDSGIHTTMWIHEWPRSDAPIGFLSPLVYARHPVSGEAVSHIFTLVLTPVDSCPRSPRRLRSARGRGRRQAGSWRRRGRARRR